MANAKFDAETGELAYEPTQAERTREALFDDLKDAILAALAAEHEAGVASGRFMAGADDKRASKAYDRRTTASALWDAFHAAKRDA